MKKLAVLFFAIALFSSSSCTHKSTVKENSFHVALADDVKTLDPANAYDEISLDVMQNIVETLYQYSYLSDTVEVEPLLAADMPKYSADRLTVTIPIRKGIHFADDPCFKETHGKGRELVAQDFVDSFKRLDIPSLESQGKWIFEGRVAGFRAPDPHTLEIRLTKPYPQLLYVLAMGFAGVIPKEAVETYADEKGNLVGHPVGTGPFILKNWDRNRQLVLERNPDYHPDFYPTKASTSYQEKGMKDDAGKRIPFLDEIVFDVVRETQPTWLSFMNGNYDAVTIPKDNFGQAISSGGNLRPELVARGMRLSVETGSTLRFLTFNFNDPLLGKNKLLRQALSAAIDRDKWIELFTNGTGQKMITGLPPGLADRPEKSALKYDFDLTRSKELLKKAGYPEGKGLPVLKLDLRGADSVNRQLGDFFAEQLAAIGVRVEVVMNTFPAYVEKLKTGRVQMVTDGWTMDYPDGENIYQLLYGPNKAPGPNDANFDSKEMNRLYEQMAVLNPGTQRAELISKMDAILQEEVPWAFGYYLARYDLSQPWVLNYRTGEVIQNRYKYFRIDPTIRKRYRNSK